MQKINFKNLPSTDTPINATNLNLMQDNIETAINSIELSGGGDEVGTVKMFSGSTAPQGWLICDGSAISRTEYAELFSAIGTTYGSGNGTTTFNIPNIKGRTVVGLDSNDTDFDTLGETGGEKEHTLTKQELPQIDIQTNFASTSGGDGSGLVYGTTSGNSNNSLVKNVNYGGQAHSILQPYIVLNYIIKASATTTTQGEIIDSLSGSSTTDAPSVHAVKGLIKYIDKTFSNFSTTSYWNVYRVQFPISDLSVSPDKILSIIVTNFMQMGAVLNVLTDSNYLTIINDSSVTNAGTITLRIWYLDI